MLGLVTGQEMQGANHHAELAPVSGVRDGGCGHEGVGDLEVHDHPSLVGRQGELDRPPLGGDLDGVAPLHLVAGEQHPGRLGAGCGQGEDQTTAADRHRQPGAAASPAPAHRRLSDGLHAIEPAIADEPVEAACLILGGDGARGVASVRRVDPDLAEKDALGG